MAYSNRQPWLTGESRKNIDLGVNTIYVAFSQN
jgi:hypothetical protein